MNRFIALLASGFAGTIPCHGGLRDSTNYSITADVLDTGGSKVTSAAYSSQTSVGAGIVSGQAATSPSSSNAVGFISQISSSTLPVSYLSWSDSYFGGRVPAAAPNADPDGDGHSNLWEWVLLRHPLQAAPPHPMAFTLTNPAPGMGQQMSLTIDLPINNLSLVILRAEFCSDLAFSTATTTTGTVFLPQNSPEGMRRFIFTDALSTKNTVARRFGRIVLSVAP